MRDRSSLPYLLVLSVVVFLGAFTCWALVVLAAGLAGLRFATSVSNPPAMVVVVAQLRDVVLPFAPAIVLSALPFAFCLRSSRRSFGCLALLGAGLAPAGFVGALAVERLFSSHAKTGGYAAEQGMDAIIALIVALLSVTAIPFWAAAGLVAARFSEPPRSGRA